MPSARIITHANAGDVSAGGHADSEQEVLRVAIGDHRFGLPTADVREVLRAVTIVPLPKAPAIVEGLIDVRGTVAPVLDIRARFRIARRALAPTDHLVIAWAGPRLVAVRVDRATDVVRIDARHVHDATKVAPKSGYVAGVALLPDGLLLIHDLRTFLDEAEAAALDEALPSTNAPAAS